MSNPTFPAALIAIVLLSACTPNNRPSPTDLDDLEPTVVAMSEIAFTLVSLGETRQLGAVVFDQLGQILSSGLIQWTTSSASVATISSSGVIAAAANGTALVIATAGSASDTAVVTVEQAPDSIVVSPTTVVLAGVGASEALTWTVLDAGGSEIVGTEVTVAISDSAVVSESLGTLTALSAGSAVVTLTSGSATSEVTVSVTIPATAAVGGIDSH